MLSNEIREMVKEDIAFNHNGRATFSQVKQVIRICQVVYARATKDLEE